MKTKPPGLGRPRRETPDTRSPKERRDAVTQKRRERAMPIVANLDKLPPGARLRVSALEILFDRTPVTIWRMVANGQLPQPIRDAHGTTWPVQQIRAILNGEVTA